MALTLRTLAISLVLVCGSGCVTERVGSDGVPIKPGVTRRNDPGLATPQSPGRTKGTTPLPTGPVAEPKRSAFTATDIQVEVQQLGNVMYDGQALPLASPSGEFIAVQSGEAPQWPALLAGPDARPSLGTKLTIYRVEQGSLRPMDVPPLEAGLMLGRSADDEGFLVESVRPAISGNSPRWIGKVNWASGKLRWLVDTADVNAHAVLTQRGEMFYCRRPLNVTSTASIILRSQNGEETQKPSIDGAFCFPVLAAGNEVFYIFHVSRVGTDLEVMRIDRSNPEGPRAGGTRHRWRISRSPDVMLAFQMASTAAPYPAGVSLLASASESDADTVAMFDPRTSRMTRFNPQTGGTESLLAKTIGAVPSVSGITGPHAMTPGYLCTGTGGLVFIAAPADGWPGAWPEDGPSARVLASPYVVRPLSPVTIAATSDVPAQRVPLYLLIGPVKGATDRLEVTRMAVVGR